jgi:Golgi phosphoprotein 3
MVAARRKLYLYEELMLLALRDKEGTFAADDMGFLYALSGCLIAELLLTEKISMEEVKKNKKMVNLENPTPFADPILDESLEKLRGAKRRATLNTWVTRLAGMKKLKHRAAKQLCRRGILRADEKSVLLIFSRKIYPELDPGPEREIVDRVRAAIFTDSAEVDPRTAVLVALGSKGGVLKNVFDKKELKARKDRIETIADAVSTASAVKEVVEGIQVALMVAITASTAASAAT